LAAQYRLPTMFGAAMFLEAGGLMAYGVNPADMGRRAAYYVDRILRDLQKTKIPYIVEPLTGTSSQVFYTDQRFFLC
jgi:ABC-type uncharacterized transport system substrate-binding protein